MRTLSFALGLVLAGGLLLAGCAQQNDEISTTTPQNTPVAKNTAPNGQLPSEQAVDRNSTDTRNMEAVATAYQQGTGDREALAAMLHQYIVNQARLRGKGGDVASHLNASHGTVQAAQTTQLDPAARQAIVKLIEQSATQQQANNQAQPGNNNNRRAAGLSRGVNQAGSGTTR